MKLIKYGRRELLKVIRTACYYIEIEKSSEIKGIFIPEVKWDEGMMKRVNIHVRREIDNFFELTNQPAKQVTYLKNLIEKGQKSKKAFEKKLREAEMKRQEREKVAKQLALISHGVEFVTECLDVAIVELAPKSSSDKIELISTISDAGKTLIDIVANPEELVVGFVDTRKDSKNYMSEVKNITTDLVLDAADTYLEKQGNYLSAKIDALEGGVSRALAKKQYNLARSRIRKGDVAARRLQRVRMGGLYVKLIRIEKKCEQKFIDRANEMMDQGF